LIGEPCSGDTGTGDWRPIHGDGHAGEVVRKAEIPPNRERPFIGRTKYEVAAGRTRRNEQSTPNNFKEIAAAVMFFYRGDYGDVARRRFAANNAFGFNCPRALAKEEKGKNFLFRRRAFATALSRFNNGAKRGNEEGLCKTLQFDKHATWRLMNEAEPQLASA